jgi:hypothetical protein
MVTSMNDRTSTKQANDRKISLISKKSRDHSSYFVQQRQKLSEQNPPKTALFSTKVFFVNGYLDLDMIDLEFRKLILAHGGSLSKSPSHAHYIIATQLNASKTEKALKSKSKKVILRPQWVLHSVEQKRLLPFRDYLLLRP